MPHLASWRRSLARYEADHRLGHVVLDVCCRFLLVGTSDLPNHDDRGCLRIGLERFETVDEVGPDERITPDPHARRLAEPHTRELEDGSEIEIDIEFSYYPGTEDYFDRSWGNWLPGDPPDFELLSAKLNGKEVELTEAEIQRLEEESCEIVNAI